MPKFIGGQQGDIQETSNRSTPGELKGIFNLSDQYTIRKGGGWIGAKGMQCQGGDAVSDYVESGKVYRAHIFTRNGTFKVLELGAYADTVEYLIMGGGGAGAGANSSPGSGGGGAGGVRIHLSGHPLSQPTSWSVYVGGGPAQAGDEYGSYTVTVGKGGGVTPGTNPGGANPNMPYRMGENSYFGPPSSPQGLTAAGGGGGGSGYYPAWPGDPAPQRNAESKGGNGGSGGGGGGDVGGSAGGGAGGYGNTPPTAPWPPQGNNGGDGHDGSGPDSGGGGGGAAGPGTTAAQATGGAGGNATPIGIAPAQFSAVAGGGGGGGRATGTGGAGTPDFTGGGGTGATRSDTKAQDGGRSSASGVRGEEAAYQGA